MGAGRRGHITLLERQGDNQADVAAAEQLVKHVPTVATRQRVLQHHQFTRKKKKTCEGRIQGGKGSLRQLILQLHRFGVERYHAAVSEE